MEADVERLFESYSPRLTEQAIETFLDVTERRFRRAVRSLPDGVYEATEHLAGDTVDTVAVIQVMLDVRGDTPLLVYHCTCRVMDLWKYGG